MNEVKSGILQKKWIHSHEEDSASEMVFRPDSYHFPPSRGRVGFNLKADQSLEQIGIAPADGPQIEHGRWELDDGAKLVFYGDSKSSPGKVMQIASADADRLVIKK